MNLNISLILPDNFTKRLIDTSNKLVPLDSASLSDKHLDEIKQRALALDLNSIRQLVYLCRENISKNKIDHWITFFEKLNLRDTELKEFYLKGYLMNHSGDLLRLRAFSENELYTLANNVILRDYVLDSFVDYETLKTNGYYSRLISELNPTTLEEETFKKSLILTQYYLEGNVPQMRKWAEALSRYPANTDYFPIINGRVWAARFIHQALKTGAIQNDLIQDWYEFLKQEPIEKVTQLVMEPLPILIKFSKETALTEELLSYVSHVIEICILQNPLVASLENAVLLACKTAFYARIKQPIKSQESRHKLVQNSCLPSYYSYIQGIANSF